jgi:murein DD-endopeptidase MepM/ murein hydrolase activator NlpD
MKVRIFAVFLLFLGLPLWALSLQAPLDEFWVSSHAGYRDDPMGGGEESRLHKGVDLVGPHAAPVHAAAAGIVVEHWPAPNGFYKGHPIFGGLVVIDHQEGSFTLYGHLSETFVHEGQRVEKGTIIGRQGNTGISTGEHLHFEVIVDPLSYFSSAESVGPDGTYR